MSLGTVLVAIAASIGNLRQGWDNATIAGNSVVPPEKTVGLSTRLGRYSLCCSASQGPVLGDGNNWVSCRLRS
uniref:Predicted protein n=1 Tax=Hordeum vulgare subsp. vulgare TaxID=112509 RepID=F2D8U2_HORVV|nr:predicted protein [Hordeum vulgare subsp. vulgare]